MHIKTTGDVVSFHYSNDVISYLVKQGLQNIKIVPEYCDSSCFNVFPILAGYSEMVSLSFSFVLSVLLVIGSLIITIVIITYYRHKCKKKSFREKTPDEPDKHLNELKEAP